MVQFLRALFKRREDADAPASRSPGRLARFARDVRGVAALEFGFIAPPFFMLLFSMFEVGLTYTADAVLQNAVNESSRQIRTGEVQSGGITAIQFRQMVCDNISVMLDCDQRLQIDVRKFTAFTAASFSSPLDANGNFRNDYKYEPGVPCDVVLVRAFYQWDPVTPGLGDFMSNMGGGRTPSSGYGSRAKRALCGRGASMLKSLIAFARRLRRNENGLSAIEFALICPVMLTSLLGAVEVSNGMLADRKVTLVTSTIADLASQDKNITDSEMNDIFAAGGAVMFPMESAPLKMRISSVVADATTGVTRVAWSSNTNWTSRAVGSVVTVPAGMVPKGASVIYAEIEYTYSSSLNNFIPVTGLKVTDQFYLRPRRTLAVTRSAS